MDNLPRKATGSRAFGAAIKGTRSEQQDAFCIRWLEQNQACLLVVADGMGGHAAGELASKLAVDEFVAQFVTARDAGAVLEESFKTALNHANARIADAQRRIPGAATMGTTLAAAYLSKSGIAWVSVGDSPIWLLRGGALSRLNEDHSLRDYVRDDAHHSGNMLRSALAGQPLPLVDCAPRPLALVDDDMIVVASDGLLTLTQEEIATELRGSRSSDPEQLSNRLLGAVERKAVVGQDNCTVILANPIRPLPRHFGLSNAQLFLAAGVLALTGISSCLMWFYGR